MQKKMDPTGKHKGYLKRASCPGAYFLEKPKTKLKPGIEVKFSMKHFGL